jgi:hypothetical protein
LSVPVTTIKRDGRVRRKKNELEKAMPWLTDGDRAAVQGWAELEVLCRRIYTKLSTSDLLTDSGAPTGLLDCYRRLRSTQLSFERELLMTPRARAEVQGHRGELPLHGAFARIRRIAEQRHGPETVVEEQPNVEDNAGDTEQPTQEESDAAQK